MGLLDELAERHGQDAPPFLIRHDEQLSIHDVLAAGGDDLSCIRPGDVVALVGDFDRRSILNLLRLIDLKTILVPLAADTRASHDYFMEAALVDVVLEGGVARRRQPAHSNHPMLAGLREIAHSGLVLFSSGTTGRPKAILHDFENFLARYRAPRPTFRTLSFLLFDHIGGINTLFHTLYNKGSVIVPSARTPIAVLDDINRFSVELLPTTPTFLRMLMMSGVLDGGGPDSLKVITYGTERMDQSTLLEICRLLPGIDVRQTYGMSELGILRVKSQSRESLWMKIGGEGVEVKAVDSVLKIRAANRMKGYLNAESPFDAEGWYDTKDLIEQDGEWLRISGRISETISVGGVKFLPSEVERAVLLHPSIVLAQAKGVPNPITGQHIELLCEVKEDRTVTRQELRAFLSERLPETMRPHLIRLGKVPVSHRFKRQ